MRPSKDFLGGVLFLCFGLGAMAVASTYSLGTPMRMGPGYFPLMIGGLIALLGLILAVRDIARSASDRVSGIAPRPLFFILTAIAAFAVLIDSWGLVAAVSVLVLLARLSRTEGTVAELIATVVALNAIAILVFISGLEIPLQIGPW